MGASRDWLGAWVGARVWVWVGANPLDEAAQHSSAAPAGPALALAARREPLPSGPPHPGRQLTS